MNKQKSKAALEFQDVVYQYFKEEWGYNLIHHTSIEKQYQEGENVQGIEIKHDQRFKQNSNNLFISVKRTYWDREATSGIMKEHNKRFYVQGNETKFYIFSLQQIREYYLQNNPTLIKGYTTAGGGIEYGFLLNEQQADQLAFEVFSNQLQLSLS